MPTLTTFEQPVIDDDNVDEREVPLQSETVASSAVCREKPTVLAKPTPKASGKRKAAAKITPSSNPASKRKKQQASSNQLSIASFFQQKNPPPASPLANAPAAPTTITTTITTTAVKSAIKASSGQRRLLGSKDTSSPSESRHIDSLALCAPTTIARPASSQNRAKPNSKMTRTMTKRTTTTKESLRDVVLGCLPPADSSVPTFNSSPQQAPTESVKRTYHDNDILPRILAPSLLKKKPLTQRRQDTAAAPTATIKSPSQVAPTFDSAPVKFDKTKLATEAVGTKTDVSVEAPKSELTANQEIDQGSEGVEVFEQLDAGKSEIAGESNVALEDCKTDEMEYVDEYFIQSNNSVVRFDQNKSFEATQTVLESNPEKYIVNPPAAEAVAPMDDNRHDDSPTLATSKSLSLENKVVDIGNKAVNSEDIVKSAQITVVRQNRIGKVQAMRVQYCSKLAEVVAQGRDGLEEETTFNLSLPKDLPSLPPGTLDFPDSAASSLAALVEGSRLSLSALSSSVARKLNDAFQSNVFTIDMVTAKVKVIAKREPFLDSPSCAKAVLPTETKPSTAKMNVFEDEYPDRMWRWEVISLDLFSDQLSLAHVKKARAARRKLRSYFKALSKLLLSLHDTEKLLCDTATPSDKLEAVEAKMSQDENQVLKFEREQEKSRLMAEARKRKQEDQVQKLEEQKRKASGIREEQKKQKAAEREEMKRKKAEERERQKAERDELKRKADDQKENERQEREAKQKRQQAQLLSFLGSKRTKSSPAVAAASAKESSNEACSEKLASVDFRSQIGTSAALDAKLLFRDLSERASTSRKRKTRMVSIPVYVTTTSDESFDAQPYLEQKLLLFPNKYKFLCFHEDCRPPYHGTWSKRSQVVTGRNPFAKDANFLDYENDSEGEWEEGDDDMGEDIESNGFNDENEDALDDDEGDLTAYNYEDGWMQRDDDFGTDIDEETKLLLQKKLQGSEHPHMSQNDFVTVVTVCAIVPTSGGVPLTKDASISIDNLVEGFDNSEALRILAVHEGEWLGADENCLDAFAAAMDELPDELNAGETPNLTQTRKKGISDLTPDDLKSFARFVHHNTLPSKDKVLDELRSLHKSLVSSRAQAARTLDAIASKKRHTDGCIRWEVNRNVLVELGLEDLVDEEKEDKIPNGQPDSSFQLMRKDSSLEAKIETKDAGSANLLQTFLIRKSDDQVSSL